LYPTHFRIGPFVISGYSACVNLGLLLGFLVTARRGRRRGFPLADVFDGCLSAALGGLVGGRIAYVLIHADYYRLHLAEVPQVWAGGLMGPGAFFGALLTLRIAARVRRYPFRELLDALTPGAAVVTTCAWLGCFLARCAYGRPTYPDQPLLWKLSLELPNLYGIREPRVAVQLLAALWSTAALGLTRLGHRQIRIRGQRLFPLWLALYSGGMAGLGALRGDATLRAGGWRADQIAHLALLAYAALLALSTRGRTRSPQ
jgi:phosphatidylglycerol:prolipoprotein diacylglycerol transferase